MAYHFMNLPILIRRLVNYFQWPKVSLMGHSMGAIASYSYGVIFPKEVDFLITFDGLHQPLLCNTL